MSMSSSSRFRFSSWTAEMRFRTSPASKRGSGFVSRGKRALFLLDEPDTHLNPLWQHSYLNLIQDWTGIAGDADNCQILVTSHNPLTIAALGRDEVRVRRFDKLSGVSRRAFR